VALLQFRAEQGGPVAAMVLQDFPADQQRGPGATRAELADQGRGLFQRHGQNRQIRGDRQALDIFVGQHPGNRLAIRVIKLNSRAESTPSGCLPAPMTAMERGLNRYSRLRMVMAASQVGAAGKAKGNDTMVTRFREWLR